MSCACHLALLPDRTSVSIRELTRNIDAGDRGHEAGGVRSAHGMVLPSRAWGVEQHGTFRVTIFSMAVDLNLCLINSSFRVQLSGFQLSEGNNPRRFL